MKTMIFYFYGFLFLQLCTVLYTQDVEMIRDYFLFKDVNNVAVFSCGNVKKDYEIVRMLSDVRISASVQSIGSNIDVTRFLYTRYWRLGVFLDLRCTERNAVNILVETSSHRMYNHLYHWLILGENLNYTAHTLNDSAFSIITDLVISIPRDGFYDFYDVYNHGKSHGRPLNITRLGTWQKHEGIKVNLEGTKFSRRWNFHGLKVKAAGIVLHKPSGKDLTDYLTEVSTVTMDNWSKFGYSVLRHVAEMFNFTLELVEVNRWDKNDTNGPLMNGLKNGTFDVVYFPSILTKERYNYARVITQVWPIRTCFMFRTIPASKVNMNIIIGPFAPDSWYMIIVMFFIIILVLSIILKVEKVDADTDCSTSILVTIGALCQQGLPSFVSQSASRIAFLQVMMFGLLVYNYYSASIVSTRLNAPLDKMNDSLYSLVNSGMKLAAERNIFFDFLLRNPKKDVQYFKKYWQTIPERKKFLSLEDGVKRISRGGFAYHADPTDAYPLIDRIFDKETICQLTEVHLLPPSELGLWSTHSGEFVEITKIGLIRIVTAGIRKRQVLRWSSRKPYCNRSKLFVSSVTIHEAAPIIIVLISGILLSIIICFIENLVFHSTLHVKQEDIVNKGSQHVHTDFQHVRFRRRKSSMLIHTKSRPVYNGNFHSRYKHRK